MNRRLLLGLLLLSLSALARADDRLFDVHVHIWDGEKSVKEYLAQVRSTGQQVTGLLAYRDEFTIGLRDSNRVYHSWPVSRVHFVVDSPVDAHVSQFSKYTDDDIHNLMAYIQTLR